MAEHNYYDEQNFKDKVKHRFRAVIIVMTLLLSAALLVFSSGVSPVKSLSTLTGAVSFGMLPGNDGPYFPMDVSIAAVPLEFQAKDATVSVLLKEAQGSITIDKVAISNLRSSNVTLSGFQGKVIVDDTGVLNVDGFAQSVTVSEGDIVKDKKKVKIIMKDVAYSQLVVSWMQVGKLTFSSTGSAQVQGRGSFELAGEKAEIQGYRGSLNIDKGKIKLLGEAAKMTLDKSPKIVLSG